jgi:proton glutamate symport protein
METKQIKLALQWQILIAIMLATIVGSVTGMQMSLFGVPFYDLYDFVGTLFLNALKMLIVPLIMSSIISGVATLGGTNDLGRLGIKTVLYFVFTTLLAVITGLILVNILHPGTNLSLDNTRLSESILESIDGRGAGDFVGIFERLIPINIVAAAVEGNMLGLIFFSIVFGYFMTRVEGRYTDSLVNFWKAIAETMTRMTLWIMRFAPYGVFGLVAKTVASTGLDAIKPMLYFGLTVTLALCFHLFITLSIILKIFGRVSPVVHFKALLPALLTAFSSASSSATLPLTMECSQKGVGVSERTSSFVLPLGATVNMNGTALYECVAAIFIAQAYGIDLNFSQQFLIVVIALLTSIGVAGIPAASLVAISVILGSIGLPLEGIGLLMVTDRLLDMMRTAVNIYSDTVGATLVARSEKETGLII